MNDKHHLFHANVPEMLLMKGFSAYFPVRLLVLPLLCFCLLAAMGCGYRHQELFTEEYQTVAVPIFENRTFYRTAEFDLSEALVKEIERRTPYKVTSPTTADTIVEGVISDIQQRMVTRRASGGVPQEIELTVTVNFQWKDLRSGEVLRDRRGFQAVGRHIVAQPMGEPIEIAQHAAMEQLAREIVSTMRADW